MLKSLTNPLMRSLALLLLISTVAFADDLAQQFQSPPASAKPHIFWMWMNGNITKEGITADLEAIQRVGIGGVQIFNISEGIPHGTVQFNSPEWRELVKYAVTEADRLGLKLGMHNAAGWSSSGGPWNTPEHSMQIAVTSEKQVRGPARFEEVIPQPKANLGFYRDAAVLAFRTPKAELEPLPAPLKITTSDGKTDATGLLHTNPAKPVVLPAPTPLQPQFIQWEFAQPQTARTLWVTPGRGVIRRQGQIESSDDGKTFRKIAAFTLQRADEQQVLTFQPTKARFFRLLFTGADPSSPKIVIAQAEFSRRMTVDSVSKKSLQAYAPGPYAEVVGDATPEEVVSSSDVLDLSKQMATDGKLTWDVPAGDWTIVRVGHTSNGRKNHPAPPEATGLECDKLSSEAVQAHWDSLMGLLTKEVGPLAGKSFANVHVDSWEVGTQNWTSKLPQEFAKRRGYDLLHFLPVLSGRVVDSPQITDRFLWDFRRTIADLFAENYSGKFAEMAHKSGMTYSVEPYGSIPGMDLEYGRHADIPMTEFWTAGEFTIPPKLAASVAHTNGRKVVGAEAFTARIPCSKWVNDPFSIKVQGDAAWCGGVNRFVFHRYAHQPWTHPTHFPGMTMGQWGMHFERTTTWWEQSKAWLAYIARAQFLLQSGQFVADVLVYCGEDVPGGMRYMPMSNVPKGYDYDGCDAETLNLASVKDGRIVLPSGMSYRVLVLPENKAMRPEIARKIKELVAAGATVIGPKPDHAPGLQAYPGCDDEVRKLTSDWGVLSGKPVGSVLSSLGVKPDVEFTGGNDAQLRSIHRKVDDTDVYFVACPSMQAEDCVGTFRVSGKQPELWHPDSGRIEPCAVWREVDGRTEVPLHFDPAGSVFVVFREPAKDDHLVAVKGDGASPNSFEIGTQELLTRAPGRFTFTYASGRATTLEVKEVDCPMELSGPWQLTFPPNWGAPAEITLDKLISWTQNPDPGVKYFSGTATYRKQFQYKVDKRGGKIELDLGAVKNLAEVRLNGKNLGILWKPPFRLDVTDDIRTGSNDLEVSVTNLWVNRLIGDEQLPEDCQWNGVSLKEWPQWLLDGKPSPTGRLTFTTWHHWTKNDHPLESGLLGPVTLQTMEKFEIPQR